MIYNGHEGLLDDIPYVTTYTTAALRPHKSRYDFIAVTGMSGVLVGSPVAIRLKVPLVVVRKPEEISHSYTDLIGGAAARGRYVFIDDFIAGGTTYGRVRERLAESDMDCRYVGCYLYSDKLLSWDGDGKVAYRPSKKKKTQAVVTYPDDGAALSVPVSFEPLSTPVFSSAERGAALRALRGLVGPFTTGPPPARMIRVA